MWLSNLGLIKGVLPGQLRQVCVWLCLQLHSQAGIHVKFSLGEKKKINQFSQTVWKKGYYDFIVFFIRKILNSSKDDKIFKKKYVLVNHFQ